MPVQCCFSQQTGWLHAGMMKQCLVHSSSLSRQEIMDNEVLQPCFSW